MTGGMIVFLEIIAPLVVLIVYGRIKVVRARRKADVADARPALPFAPKPEPTPNALLRSFSTPQRTYLRQQIALAKGCSYIVGWVSLVLSTSGLLPPSIRDYGLEQPLAQRVWYSYLTHVAAAEIWFAIAALMGAIIAVSALTSGAPAVFNRTRPLTRRFLFWARVLPAIASILAAVATGAIVSFLLLVVFYGPVWLHLLDTAQRHNGHLVLDCLTPRLSSHVAYVLQTSAPRILLSIATTALLAFSVFTALIAQPFGLLRKGAGKSMIVWGGIFGAILGVRLAREANGIGVSHFARALFVYLSPGPPPPYVYALVPLAASALLLCLAQFLVARKEL